VILKSKLLNPTLIQHGVQFNDSKTFYRSNTIRSAANTNTNTMEFEVHLKKRQISYSYAVNINANDQKTSVNCKVIIPFTSIGERIRCYKTNSGTLFLLIHTNLPPNVYKINTTLYGNESLYRLTDLSQNFSNFGFTTLPSQFIHKVLFSNKDQRKVMAMLRYFQCLHPQLICDGFQHSPFNDVRSYSWLPITTPPKSISDKVQYLIECAISWGSIYKEQLSPRFFEILSVLPKPMQLAFFSHILWDDSIADKLPLANPAEYLCWKVQHQSETVREKKVKPMNANHVYTKTISITPISHFCHLPMMELSNRILRDYKQLSDRFVRITFCEEDLKGLVFEKSPEFHNKITHLMTKGIHIAGRHYRFLAYSTSQLRQGSCWFFSETNTVTCASIRSKMGDLSRIKNVAKYAARMGQCFSTIFDTSFRPNWKEIKDIERNGFTFSGTVSAVHMY